MIFLRAAARFSDWVVTTIPSLTGVLQAVMLRSTPSTSTAHIRQAPVGEIFCSQQRVGMVMPSCRAASRMVVPAGTLIFLPSIVKLTIFYYSSDFRAFSLMNILIRAARNRLSLQRLCLGIVGNCSVAGTD